MYKRRNLPTAVHPKRRKTNKTHPVRVQHRDNFKHKQVPQRNGTGVKFIQQKLQEAVQHVAARGLARVHPAGEKHDFFLFEQMGPGFGAVGKQKTDAFGRLARSPRRGGQRFTVVRPATVGRDGHQVDPCPLQRIHHEFPFEINRVVVDRAGMVGVVGLVGGCRQGSSVLELVRVQHALARGVTEGQMAGKDVGLSWVKVQSHFQMQLVAKGIDGIFCFVVQTAPHVWGRVEIQVVGPTPKRGHKRGQITSVAPKHGV